MPVKYRIYELSARALISHAEEQGGVYRVRLDRSTTEKCFVSGAAHEQEDNALFYQIMCALHGDGFEAPCGDRLVPDLSDIIFYMSFEHIFDRNGQQKKYGLRQQKAKDLFRPEGIVLDLGSGAQCYLAFERSASMSRHAQLSFLRADLYESVRRRIMMDIHIGDGQLSKLYAYNGLMLSGGVRVDGVEIDRPGRVIVIDNEKYIAPQTEIVTVADDGTQNSTRKYHRVERCEDVEVLCFDGEGLISMEYAKTVDRAYCGGTLHTSFQIRLPYVKGMLHQVDFKEFLSCAGMKTITDLWGAVHDVANVDIILTKSMFKGYGWLTDDGKSWADYWDAFRRYHHALYITGVSKEKPTATTELNYQFFNTLTLDDYDFRPDEVPALWENDRAKYSYPWLTKKTELAYYQLCADEQFRLDYFVNVTERITEDGEGSDETRNGRYEKERALLMARLLKKNPRLLAEPVFTKELDAKAEAVLKQYSIGHLTVDGDNRYLSADLLELLLLLVNPLEIRTAEARIFYVRALTRTLRNDECYAPGSVYLHEKDCTILRNPHIAKNEEVLAFLPAEKDALREHYLGHLTDVVMVSARGLSAERLGGADFDGDMVKTITDPIVCHCVNLNSVRASFNGKTVYSYSPPLLHIPAAKPRMRDADDWHARFETVSSTFSSRVGQICNAALDRSVIAYNENIPAKERERCRQETETLAILTGLEIDSAKSGVRPDLGEYLGQGKVPRTPFLQYKALVEEREEKRAWYEQSRNQKIEAFFKKTDWTQTDSYLERLPHMARQLKKCTPKLRTKPATDSELFIFAQNPHWRDELDADTLADVAALLRDYEACLSRIRACRAPVAAKHRESDLNRILYVRGQENEVDTDELYALLQALPPERVSALRQTISEKQWFFMNEPEREAFLLEWLPETDFADRYDLFSDFRSSGFKLLGDLVCDIDDENAAHERKALHRETDAAAFTAMMNAYTEKSFSGNYSEAVAEACRTQLNRIVEPVSAIQYVTALGKRKLLFDLLPDAMEKTLLEVRHDK